MHNRPCPPSPEREPAWRAACLAYREERRAGRDLDAYDAAVAALQAVWPLPDAERSSYREGPTGWNASDAPDTSASAPIALYAKR
jgi:hypothetical protein